MALPQPKAGAWTTDFCDCCAAPGGAGRCASLGVQYCDSNTERAPGLYHNFCFPCALGGVVDRVVAADPSATHLHGCCGNACCTFYSFNIIPYIGICIAINTLLPPLRRKIAPAGAPPDNCLAVLCCAPCALTQAENELDLREAAGQPILQSGQVMVMAPAAVFINPVMAK